MVRCFIFCHINEQTTSNFFFHRSITSTDTTARLRTIESPRPGSLDEDFIPPSSDQTMIEAMEGRLIHNTPHSEDSKSDHDKSTFFPFR